MRFFADGPDIPDDLLVARDAGDVIFFCGAGVSQHKARLPNFEKLGRRVIEILGATNESPARALLDKALEVGRMAGVGGLVSTDRVFGLLEREFEVGDVRAAVAEAIRPPDGYGLDAHRILLDLARSPTGVTRIVTTNFDLLFEECDATLPSFGPPNLPDPRTARDFRGVFHLHGRVDASYRAPRDDEFVVSSRDFGRAYLLDGWATRFIQSLLARFQIVFIGYTADDPPVQYLLEALNLQAGNRARLYALQDGESGEAAALWEHRGVRAIPFDASKGFQPLWDTLAAWAGRARDIDRWYDELLAVASNGPAELSPHIRGQIAHVYSTREGAKRVAAANTLPDGSWLLTLDPQQRYRRPVPVDRSDVSKELFDPFEALGLDSDIVPQPPQPDQNLIDRRIPPAAWDVLKPTRADIEGMSETGGGVLRGHVVPHAAALPPRLMSTAIWIKRVAHQPITLWWASQQSGLHQRLRREIEFDLRVNGDRFPAAIHRGWRILFAAWDDAGPAHDSAFEINARADREGWTESLVRAAVELCRPRLKAGHNWRVSHPLNVEGPISPDDVIRFDVDYPSPPLAPSIPEDQLGYAVKQCRANLELAISLEAEIIGNDRLHFETSRADDGEVLAENSHGLTGAIVRMQNLMTRLAAKDRRAARAEIGKWPTDDLYVFARLRIWAAGKKILAPREAAKIFVSLPDNVFWGSLHERDLLYALRDRWADLGKSDREALEDRLRQGSYPWEATVHGDPIVWAASDRMSRLHWLRQSGVAFSFDVSAEMRALQGLAPEWKEKVGNAAADSNAPRVYRYFLTVFDLVRYARSRDILCQGRGSAANSAVCFCLGVTSVNPGEIDVLFERFISASRNEPPDIDIDFEHERREEVMQYIYEKYGRHRAGLVATVITYREKMAIREVGKVLGLSEDVVGALSGALSWQDEVKAGDVRAAGLDPGDGTLRLAITLASELVGFPRHLSQHTGGFVITRASLDDTIPIGNAAMADRTMIEWNKDDLDELGLLKIDVLALGMLTCLRKGFNLIGNHYGTDYTLASIPQNDSKTYDMICRADTLGVFQIESRAQMSMLPRLKPRCYYDLVIEVAIVRPGPIQGDMVHPYLRRRQGLEDEHYESDALKAILSKTLGVPLFQEQCMRLSMVAAGFTPERADELRRAMATFKRVGTIHSFKDDFLGGMARNGYSVDFAERCFAQIQGFGTYGFPEAHAASFALLVYVSCYLKCHYPDAFACALLNSQPMGFYAPAQIVRDLREHGGKVRAVDINHSDWDCSLEKVDGSRIGHALRLGFREIKGFSDRHAAKIVTARGEPFTGIEEFARRTGLGVGPLRLLARRMRFAPSALIDARHCGRLRALLRRARQPRCLLAYRSLQPARPNRSPKRTRFLCRT